MKQNKIIRKSPKNQHGNKNPCGRGNGGCHANI